MKKFIESNNKINENANKAKNAKMQKMKRKLLKISILISRSKIRK